MDTSIGDAETPDGMTHGCLLKLIEDICVSVSRSDSHPGARVLMVSWYFGYLYAWRSDPLANWTIHFRCLFRYIVHVQASLGDWLWDGFVAGMRGQVRYMLARLRHGDCSRGVMAYIIRD